MSKIAIVGQNCTALFAAAMLEKAGHEVVVLDSAASHFSHLNASPFEVSAIPSEAQAFDALAALEAALDITLVGGEVDHPPVYFSGNELKPFVGFGETKFTSIAPLSAFNISKTLELKQELVAAARLARERFSGKVMTYTEVTRAEVGADRIDHLVLNSGENLHADFFVFCTSPRSYLNVIPADMMNARLRSRMLKSPVWTRVKIHFQHTQPLLAPELCGRSIYMIPGGTTHEPFVGSVFSTPEGISSIWQSYVSDELSEDPEVISGTIKHMRRMLQKAFPAEEFRKESLLMAEPESFADFAWARDGIQLEDDLENVVLGSALLSNYTGLMGCVEIAHKILTKVSEPRQKRTKEPSILATDTASC